MVISWKELSSSTARSVGRDVRRVAQQRVADVAPQVDGAPGGLQQLCDDGGGGGLAVGAGDGDLGQGQTSKKTSISLVSTLPRSTAAASSGTSGRRPGVRKITSSVRSFR